MQQVSKPRIIEKLEESQRNIPATIHLVAAIIQESMAELVSPLLMIGLILSMSNFLLNGAVFGAWAGIPVIWVIVQSVAVDANLGIMVVRGVRNLHKGEWGKGIIYLVIAVALLFVAAVITDVEAVRSVLDRSIETIFIHLHISVEVLTFVRSSAIVALVAATQLDNVSLRRASATTAPTQVQPIETEQLVTVQPIETEAEQGNIEEVLAYLHTYTEQRREREGSVESEGKGTGTSRNTDAFRAINALGTQRELVITDEQHHKLMNAWKQLRAKGPVSINKLQKSAGVRREAAAHWLNNEMWKDDLWIGTPEMQEISGFPEFVSEIGAK